MITENGGPTHLFRNDGGNKNHALRLDLKGVTSNRDALGARVTVEVGGQTARRQLFLSKGYLSSVEHPLTFGLGQSDKADKVTIVWPSGKTSVLQDVLGGKTITIDESGVSTSTK